jgi:RNA polymerase sigma-70 factor (family 1)
MSLLPPDTNDAALLASISQRKETALDTLMKRYWEGLFRKCYALLRDEDAAKDCVQEIFISLWRHESPTEIENLDHWLHQAARFRAMAAIRTAKRKALIEDHASKLTTIILYSDGLNSLLLKELKEKLEKVIGTFPEQQQQVWRLNREEGMTYKEIAEALGISQKTVEKKMSASLKILRKNFDKELGEAMVLGLLFQYL